MAGPLSGIKVIDITTMMLGPYATQMLGDMGADVIKIEAPGGGDPIRDVGPSRNSGMSGIFLNLNRNKRSAVLDLKSPQGRGALLTLLGEADVFVHNMRPKAVERIGLGYDALTKVKPDIIYGGAYGFGQDGPYADRPAYDDTIQAMTGMASMQSAWDGQPRYQATIPADKTVAIYFALAIVAALFHRARTGQGQMVEVPMFETMAAWMLAEHIYGAAFEPPLSEPVYPRVVSPHRRPYATLDGYIALVAYSDKQWHRLFAAAGRADLICDPRFASVADRTTHVDRLYEAVGEIVSGRTTAECLRIFGEADIPVVPLSTTTQLLNDPHLKAVGFFDLVNHPTEGAIWHIKSPLRFSATPVEIRRGAPRLGADTDDLVDSVEAH